MDSALLIMGLATTPFGCRYLLDGDSFDSIRFLGDLLAAACSLGFGGKNSRAGMTPHDFLPDWLARERKFDSICKMLDRLTDDGSRIALDLHRTKFVRCMRAKEWYCPPPVAAGRALAASLYLFVPFSIS